MVANTSGQRVPGNSKAYSVHATVTKKQEKKTEL